MYCDLIYLFSFFFSLYRFLLSCVTNRNETVQAKKLMCSTLTSISFSKTLAMVIAMYFKRSIGMELEKMKCPGYVPSCYLVIDDNI